MEYYIQVRNINSRFRIIFIRMNLNYLKKEYNLKIDEMRTELYVQCK